MKPILFVTNFAPPSRIAEFAALAKQQQVEFALVGGRMRHAAGESEHLPFPHQHLSERAVLRLAASGRYRAVICGTAGRVALPAAYAGARKAGVPFILWTGIWAHPRTAAHAVSWLPLRHIYRHADAVITYGSHVSNYVRKFGAKQVFEAAQAVDNKFWSSPASEPISPVPFRAIFVGRLEHEKGIEPLLGAWQELGLTSDTAELLVVGEGSLELERLNKQATVRFAGYLNREQLRNSYAGSDVLVLPSLRTRNFREPWGLCVNEAMNQSTTVITSDQVGAAAGGLVQHGRTGLVVPAGDTKALSSALSELYSNEMLRKSLGNAGSEAVTSYTHEAWVSSFTTAIESATVVRSTC